jgi:hypothetical protein
MQLNKRLLSGTAFLAGGLIVAAVWAAPAAAGTLTFDFGSLVGGGAYSCTGAVGAIGSDCTDGGSKTYSLSGVNVTATAFAGNSSPAAGATLSQRFNTDASGEAGLGVASHGEDKNSGSLLEIGSHLAGGGALDEYLVIDNSDAISKGYTELSLLFASLQGGEGGQVDFYNLASLGATLDLTKLVSIATTTLGGGVTQTVTIPVADNTKPFLVIAAHNSGDAPAGNVLLSNEIFNTPAVPEPATIALLGSGLASF